MSRLLLQEDEEAAILRSVFCRAVVRSQHKTVGFRAGQRILLVLVGLGLLSLLVLAALLEPDGRGYGTHRRLGLPPCTFLQLTGTRCPSCGMTTAWAHLVRGQPVRSFRANAGGALLGLAALVVAPWVLVSGLRGRWVGRPPGERMTLAMVFTLLAVTLVDHPLVPLTLMHGSYMTAIRPALYRSVLAFTLTVIMLASSGCIGLTAQLLYWMNGGHKIDPEYEGLKDKRVAVVCVSNDSTYGPNSVCWMLQRSIAGLLTEKGDDIELVDVDEIADWVDTNDWNQMDYREIGRGVNADMVLAVDVNSLSLHEGRTMYKGRADVTVTVLDMHDGGKVVFRRNLPEFTFPQDGARHVGDVSEARFRTLFVRVLAEQVAKYFCTYRIEEDFGNGARTLGA